MQGHATKYNLNRLKRNKSEKWKQTLGDEILRHRGKVKGMRGVIAMDSIADEQLGIVFTFCDAKEDMDAFYCPGNRVVASFLEKARPFMKGVPERSDYAVADLAM